MEMGAGAGYIDGMNKKPKRPRDPSQLAKMMIDIAVGESSDTPPPSEKDPAAVERGRAGGLKGGKARAKILPPEDRTDMRPVGSEQFAQQVAAIYNGFAERQERLGAEFEAAIFSDLESLYEA